MRALPICCHATAWTSVLLLCGTLSAGATDVPSSRPLIVATRNVPPFAFPVEDGTWSGISIELWRKIAAELQLTFEFREVSLEAMIDGLSEHKIDAAVAALTMTREREEQIDFTHPFYNSGLAIAARTTSSGWVQALGRLVVPLGKVIAGLALLLLVVGLLVWLFERRRNPEQFGGGTLRGIGSSFWWSAVTMTTVGYGDMAPRTVGGRLLAIVWMFTGIIVISGFTAGITTALTLSQLVAEISGPEDLPGLRVATVSGSTAKAYLQRHHISTSDFDSPHAALDALVAGQVDAVVYDAPILKYLLHAKVMKASSIKVVPGVFAPQRYALALPQGSRLREPINRLVLEYTEESKWRSVLSHYLGR